MSKKIIIDTKGYMKRMLLFEQHLKELKIKNLTSKVTRENYIVLDRLFKVKGVLSKLVSE